MLFTYCLIKAPHIYFLTGTCSSSVRVPGPGSETRASTEQPTTRGMTVGEWSVNLLGMETLGFVLRPGFVRGWPGGRANGDARACPCASVSSESRGILAVWPLVSGRMASGFSPRGVASFMHARLEARGYQGRMVSNLPSPCLLNLLPVPQGCPRGVRR